MARTTEEERQLRIDVEEREGEFNFLQLQANPKTKKEEE